MSSRSTCFEGGDVLLKFAGKCRVQRTATSDSVRKVVTGSCRNPCYYKNGYHLKALQWPEEDLTSTAGEGTGFYPLRICGTFNDGRFVITRRFG